jgi:uncharacterized protein YceK
MGILEAKPTLRAGYLFEIALLAKGRVARTVPVVRNILAATVILLVSAGCSQVDTRSEATRQDTVVRPASTTVVRETTTTGAGIKAPMPTIGQEGYAGKMRTALLIETAMRSLALESHRLEQLHQGAYTYGFGEILYSGVDPRSVEYLEEGLYRAGGLGNMSVTVINTDGESFLVVSKGERTKEKPTGKVDALEITDGLATACHWVTADSGTSGIGLRGECSETAR